MNVNGDRAGGAFGYVDMGGWVGGQADYVMAPYADFNLLKFPDKDQALEKIEDLTLLSDIFPTGYDGAVKAGVTTGSMVYVAGAGPVGLACAAACQLLGAAVVIVGDMIPERLAQARSFGCETIDLRERVPLEATSVSNLKEAPKRNVVDPTKPLLKDEARLRPVALARNENRALALRAGRYRIYTVSVSSPGQARVSELHLTVVTYLKLMRLRDQVCRYNEFGSAAFHECQPVRLAKARTPLSAPLHRST